MSAGVIIRDLETLAELEQLQALEGLVWQGETTPTYQTLTNVHNGGFALGAYQGEQMVGFVFCFPGFKNRRVYLCCHMVAIHPDFRRGGLGILLMQAMRERALSLGYTLIIWTFDPLETVNGRLYLHKLPAVGAAYSPNHYGTLNDGLNDGLPTDRLVVHWWIAGPHALTRPAWLHDLSLAEARPAFRVDQAGPLPRPGEPERDHGKEAMIRLAVPADFQAIKERDMASARLWRERTSECFLRLYQQDYVAVDLNWTRGETLCHYLFLPRARVVPALSGES